MTIDRVLLVCLTVGCSSSIARRAQAPSDSGTVAQADDDAGPDGGAASPADAGAVRHVDPVCPASSALLQDVALCEQPPCANVPSPVTARLSAVWEVARDDVWAGGSHTLMHWDGSRWNLCSVDDEIVSLWGSADDDVWAADGAGILRWDGRSWSLAFAHANVAHLSGSGPRDVWATATDAVWHWDGAAWSAVDVPPLSGTPSLVWAAGPADVWVTSGPHAAHWDGQSWTQADPGLSEEVDDATSDAIRVVDIDYLGGAAGVVCAKSFGGAAACHENGRWTTSSVGYRDTLADSGGWATALYVAAPRRLWTAIFSFGTDGMTPAYGYASFGASSGLTFTPRLAAVTGKGDSDIWAVGEFGFLVHFDGSQGLPSLQSPVKVQSVWSDGGDHVWAVAGTHDSEYEFAQAIWRQDDKAWVQDGLRLNEYWQDAPLVVGGAAGQEPWAAGMRGYLAHRVSGTWQVVPEAAVVNHNLTALWSDSADEIWAMSEAGTVLHWDGTKATTYALAATSGPVQLVGSSATDLWALTSAGLQHFDGAAFAPVTTPPGSALRGIWTNVSGELWAIDSPTNGASTIWHVVGGAWTAGLSMTDGTQWHAIAGLGAHDVWVGGTRDGISKLSHFDGTSWSAPLSVNLASIDAIQPVPGGRLWIQSAGAVWGVTP